MTADLVAFLNARLDEDEAHARRGEEVFAAGWPDYQTFDSPELTDAGRYLDHFGPARVLREVEAKRAILAEHQAVCKLADLTGQEIGFLGWYREWVLKNVAAVYSDHPDYRPEWKP